MSAPYLLLAPVYSDGSGCMKIVARAETIAELLPAIRDETHGDPWLVVKVVEVTLAEVVTC